MFTGIVEELGQVRAIAPRDGGARLELACTEVSTTPRSATSIAVNGCCLTVVELGEAGGRPTRQIETLDRTTLGALAPGDPVNLERPMRLGDRLGGHLVLGHVDGVGEVSAVEPLADGSTRGRRARRRRCCRYLVEKGSVTVDGVSLTITTVDRRRLRRRADPAHPRGHHPRRARAGDRVNLEADMIAKHVERLMHVSRLRARTHDWRET